MRAALILLTLLSFLPQIASAKLFRNSYLQFELPERWNCVMEGTEWVCSSQNKNDSKESIIILTAKEVGPQDTMAAYQNFLKTPKQVTGANGKKALSQVRIIRTIKINDQQWVDSLHLGSEIPGYYTRYLAMVKDRLAILVTFSAHQKSFTKYSGDFFRAVDSLRVVASKDLFASKALAPVKPGSESLGAGGASAPLPGGADASGLPPDEEESSGPDPVLLGGGFLVLAAVGYYLIKRK